jgi:hypothetical protein
VCQCVLPLGDNPIAGNKYIISKNSKQLTYSETYLDGIKPAAALPGRQALKSCHSHRMAHETHKITLGHASQPSNSDPN